MRKRLAFLVVSLLAATLLPATIASAGGPPGYEPAYYNGQTVTINAIDVHQNPKVLEHASADLYEVVYPTDHSLWPQDPQCNPCDHMGDGLTFDDYHDHVLDSVPSSPGHGEYRVPWHVYVVMPAQGKDAEYAALLPLDSEAKIDQAISDGVAIEVDTNFYFLCAVVNPNAAN
ncbi:MAG: hypothetical protein WB239_05860 [Acidimicrobiia bacterium]